MEQIDQQIPPNLEGDPEAYYKAKGVEVLLAADVARKYNIKPNSLTRACGDKLFHAFQLAGSKLWRIPDTPEFRKWLEGYHYRAGRGQGPKSLEYKNQPLSVELNTLFDRLQARARRLLVNDPDKLQKIEEHLGMARAILEAEAALTNEKGLSDANK